MATTILKISGSTGDWFVNGNDVFQTIGTQVTTSALAGVQTIAGADSAAGLIQGEGWRGQISGYGIGRLLPESGSLPGDFSWANVTHANVRAYVRCPNRVDDNHEVGFFFGNVTGTWGSTTYEIAHTNYTGTVVVPVNAFSGSDPAFQLYQSGNISVSIPSAPAEPALFIDTVTNSASMANDGITVEWDAIDVVLTYTPSGGSFSEIHTYSGAGTAALTLVKQFARSLSFVGTGSNVLSKLQSFLKSLSFVGSGTSAFAKAANRLLSFSYSGAGVSVLTKGKIFMRDLVFSATGTLVSALTKTYDRVLAYAATGSQALTKTANRLLSFVYGGTGTQTQTKIASFLRAFSFSGSGASLLTKGLLYTKELVYSAVGSLSTATQRVTLIVLAFAGAATSALTKQLTFQQAFVYAGTATAATTKLISKLFSYAGTATSQVVKGAAKILSYAASGAVSLVETFITGVSASVSAIGTALLNKVYIPWVPPGISAIVRYGRRILRGISTMGRR